MCLLIYIVIEFPQCFFIYLSTKDCYMSLIWY